MPVRHHPAGHRSRRSPVPALVGPALLAAATACPFGAVAAPAPTTTPPAAATTTPTNAPPTTPPQTTPAASTPAPAPWYSRIAVSGSIDMYYDYNPNSPHDHLNQLQNFTFHSNQLSIPLAELVLQETPDPANSPLGFKLVLAYGDATDWIHGGGGSAEAPYKNILQAYGTYIARGKSARPITINFGKFVTWNGQEVIESQNNWNYTHGLLFAWAIPYYHAGVSASIPLTSKMTLTGYLVNGWNDVVDTNNAKTVGYSHAWTITPKVSLTSNGTFGPEGAEEKNWRELFDEILTITPTGKWSFVANYDWAHDKPGGTNVHWDGIAGYAHYTVSDKSAWTVRGEYFDDHDGFAASGPAPIYGGGPGGMGTIIAPPSGHQQIKEATVTYEYKFHPRNITRFEVREDWSSASVFEKGGSASKSQTQFVIGDIFTF